MVEHSLTRELLETPEIKRISKEIEKREKVPVFLLQFPDTEELEKEAYRWAHSLFADCKSKDPRPEPIRHKNRLVLQHPEGLRIRTYYASGYLEYRNLERAYAGMTKVTSLKEAEVLVEEFASKHALWPDGNDQELETERIRFVKSQGSSTDGEATDIFTNNTIVVYKRLTKGIPWVGPGSKIVAMIESQEIVGFNRYWRQVIIDPIQTVPLIALDTAIELMLDGLCTRLGGAKIGTEDISLERAFFGYYAAGKRKLQRFLQPVYMFVYRIVDKFAPAGFVDVVLAHEEKFEPLAREPAEPIGQLNRSVLGQRLDVTQ